MFPSQEWHCNSWPQGPYISSFWGSPPFLLCWELFVVNICLLIWKLSVLKIKPKPVYMLNKIFLCHKVVLDFLWPFIESHGFPVEMGDYINWFTIEPAFRSCSDSIWFYCVTGLKHWCVWLANFSLRISCRVHITSSSSKSMDAKTLILYLKVACASPFKRNKKPKPRLADSDFPSECWRCHCIASGFAPFLCGQPPFLSTSHLWCSSFCP